MEEDIKYVIETMTMGELFEQQYITKGYIVDNFLYNGTYIFAGSPKVGKSFLVTQIAYHVSKGLPLWERDVKQGDVLYLALEDTYQRLQSRLYKMFGAEPSDNLHIAVNAGNFTDGNLIHQLENFLMTHRNTRLVIIDTLQKIRETSSDYNYGKDYDVISELKSIADSYEICILIVHHTRKQEATDRLDTISGTNGLFGASDGAYVMYKKNRIGNEAFIDMSTRDSSDNRIRLIRDGKTLCWNAVDNSIPEKEPAEELVDLIGCFINQENPRWEGTATDLLEDLNLTGEITARTLSYKINLNTNILYDKYGICTHTRKSNGKRLIKLLYDDRTGQK